MIPAAATIIQMLFFLPVIPFTVSKIIAAIQPLDHSYSWREGMTPPPVALRCFSRVTRTIGVAEKEFGAEG